MTASAEAHSAARGSQRGIPDFYIVGHPKCGTTALYEMLRDHPQIFMPELKEPWFFASDMRPRFQPPRSAPPFESIEEYRTLFAGAAAGQRIGEASSAYLLSHTAAERIAEVRPDARIIAILREPASFLRSLHIQLLRTHVESERSLRRAIALEPDRRAGRKVPRRSHRPQLLMYSDHIRYVEQLHRYHEVFPPEQVLVLIYDDFRADNERTVRTVRRFLGVEEASPVRATDANSTTVMMRSQQMDELLNVISVGRGPISRGAKAVLKAVMPGALRKQAMHATQRHLVMGKPEPLDEELMVELRRRFRGEVEAVGEYLERDLAALWGYDHLD